jgi:hypothetical protein
MWDALTILGWLALTTMGGLLLLGAIWLAFFIQQLRKHG